MGSWSISCVASKLTVDDCDEVYLFPLKKSKYGPYNAGTKLVSNHGCFVQYSPAFPLLGRYCDYGCVDINENQLEFVDGVYKITHGENYINDFHKLMEDQQFEACVILKEIWDSIVQHPQKSEWKSYLDNFSESLKLGERVIEMSNSPDSIRYTEDPDEAGGLAIGSIRSILGPMGHGLEEGYRNDLYEILEFIVEYDNPKEIEKLRDDFYDVYALMHSNNRNFEICTTGPQWSEREDERKLNLVIKKFLDNKRIEEYEQEKD